MSSADSEKPPRRRKGTVVARTTIAKSAKPQPTNRVSEKRSTSSATAQEQSRKEPTTKRSKSPKTGAAAKPVTRVKRRPPSAVPNPTLATYFAPFDGARAMPMVTGVLSVIGAIILVVADYLPYVRLGSQTVSAPISFASVLAHVALVIVVAACGGALIVGRAGRTALAALVPLIAVAPGHLVKAVYDGGSTLSHPGAEYYFGSQYDTSTVAGEIGRTLTIVACIVLILAGLALAAAWRSGSDTDLIPLDGARRFPAGAAATAALLAIVALLVPSAIPAVKKYSDPTGLVLTEEIDTPASAISGADLSLVAGILLIAGWLVAGAFVGTRATRSAMVTGLLGLGTIASYAALLNLRDVSAGADVVGGPRLYLYTCAGVLAFAAAGYAARVRRAEPENSGHRIEGASSVGDLAASDVWSPAAER